MINMNQHANINNPNSLRNIDLNKRKKPNLNKTMNILMEVYRTFWCRSFRELSLLAACLSQVSDNCKQYRPISHVNVILAIGLHSHVLTVWGGIKRREEQTGGKHCLF